MVDSGLASHVETYPFEFNTMLHTRLVERGHLQKMEQLKMENKTLRKETDKVEKRLREQERIIANLEVGLYSFLLT